ncbi:FitA-like ribbon-helix-helix domain-containing protein [Rhodothalassium salexigens]|uniref:FitA-like ribbon-helix-helix domain-containing protein n=1 Tax=Rhodothalassium salexigens TaxID=1086 RepID=UPI003D344CB9
MTIHDLDDSLRERLRRRAVAHGWSMEEEVRAILRDAVGDQAAPRHLATAIRKRVAPFGGVDLDIPKREPIRELDRLD